jgi:ubiquitin-protein ligase
MEPSVQAQKRILKDVKDIMRQPLVEEGVYYIHDEDNMMKGYVMIRANDDSPFRHGFFFFEIIFPFDYPTHPPKVLFYTGDGNMRFHPNLYTNGKVCLSILNTWHGEQWSSSMTLRSILVTLTTLFDWKCLLMEPGVKNKVLIKQYDDFVRFKTFEIAFSDQVIRKCVETTIWNSFYPIIERYVRENRENIEKDLEEFIDKFTKLYGNQTTINLKPYDRMVVFDVNSLTKSFHQALNHSTKNLG